MSRIIITTIMIGAGFLALSPASAQDEGAAIDPCPKVIDAARQTPGDLSAVQSDIERYTLCVQRAVLLQRLNEMAAQNAEDVTPTLTLDSIEGLPYSRAEIEEMINNLQAREEEVANLINQETDSAQESMEAVAAEEAGSKYSISELLGTGGDMEVNLVDQDQVPYRVKVGSELPDGSTVVSISAQKVVLAKDGKQKTIGWAAAKASEF